MYHNLLPHSGILSVSVYIYFLLQYLLPFCTWYLLTEHPISHLAKRLSQYAPQQWLLKFPINLWSAVQTDNQHHHLFTTYLVSFYYTRAQTQQACGLGEPGWQGSPAWSPVSASECWVPGGSTVGRAACGIPYASDAGMQTLSCVWRLQRASSVGICLGAAKPIQTDRQINTRLQFQPDYTKHHYFILFGFPPQSNYIYFVLALKCHARLIYK